VSSPNVRFDYFCIDMLPFLVESLRGGIPGLSKMGGFPEETDI
jgi:hypothetical protein